MNFNIKPNILDNDLYNVNGVNNKNVSVNFFDIQNTTSRVYSYKMAQLGLNLYQKTFSLNRLDIPLNIPLNNQLNDLDNQNLIAKYLYYNIKNELNKEFIKKATDLGTLHRNKNSTELNKRADIIIYEKDIKTKIIPKLIGTSSLIATGGRYGPAHWILSNTNTYKDILLKLEESPIFNNNKIMIGNMTYITDDLVDDDIIIMGRKTNTEQSGLQCLIETDENGFIKIYESEIINFPNYQKTKNFTIHFTFADIGFNPEYQYYKLNTRDRNYYRYKKLLKLKELYG